MTTLPPTEDDTTPDPTPVGEALPLYSIPDDERTGDPDDPDPDDDAGTIEGADPTDEVDTSQTSTRRRTLVASVVLAIVGALVVGFLVSDSSAPPPQPDIPLDAWAPYWTLDLTIPDAERRLGSMREISPFWFNATGADEISVDPNADADSTAEFLQIARSSDVSIVPSIVDAMPAGAMAAVLAEPDARAQHVDTIVAFADDGDFDGIDLDYEKFAFADGRDTWEATRPNWVAFVEELADRLHTDGRTLTVSIPPVYDAGRTDDSGFWVYDHGAIARHVDRIRIMAYDFSVGNPGPIAPLEFVERAIDGALDATDAPEKLVLGLAAYGRNWAVGTTGECAGLELEGTSSVTARSVDDLIELREVTPAFDEVTGEWSFSYDLGIDGSSCVQQRRVHYVDGDGVRLRMDLARQNALDGVSLWAFGFDDDDMWTEILPTVDAS